MPNNHGLTLSLKKSNPLETDCENLYVLIGAYPDAILIFHGVVAKPVEAPDQERGFVYSGGQWYELLAWFGLQYPPEVPVKLIPDRENWAVKPDPVQLRLTRPDITDKPEPAFESIPRLKTLRLRWGEGFALGSNFFCTVRRVRCEDEGQLTPGSSTLVDGTVEVLFQTTREDDEPTIFHGEKYFPRVEKFYEVWKELKEGAMVYWIEGTTWFRGLVNEVLFPENVKDKTIYVEVGSLERMVRDRGSGQEQWVKREKGEVSKIASQLLSLSRK